jgi:hypothetical protein
MDEWIRLESSAQLTCLPQCLNCATPQATFRCVDCFMESLFCQECLVSSHRCEPFHNLQVFRISVVCAGTNFSQRWTGSHFVQVSLRDLGAIFHLGHDHGSSCTIPSSPISLTVFDVTGVHSITVTYCECKPNESAVPPRVQLLCVRWFPATWQRPGTAFTFRLLNFLHKLQSTCKVNLYDFHNAMVAASDNAGLRKSKVSYCRATCVLPKLTRTASQPRYNELSLVFRIYVYMRLLRRGGCAHVVGGLAALSEGALAVECPACPHPGRNIDFSGEKLKTRPP